MASPALFNELRSFMSEIGQQKAAAAKKAEAYTEPGSVGGQTTHPVGTVPDNTQKAQEGSRSSENTADVKKDVPAGGVDSAAAGGPDQESRQFNVGLASKSTGKDPATEDAYKGTKDDPGTTHPAKTDDGEKYGAAKYAGKSFDELYKQAGVYADRILAAISAQAIQVNQKQAQSNQPSTPPVSQTQTAKPQQPVQKEAAQREHTQAAQVGYALASLDLGQLTPEQVKKAEQRVIEDNILSVFQDAQYTADLVGQYVVGLRQQQKAAADEDDANNGEEHAGKGEDEGGSPGGESGGGKGGGSGSDTAAGSSMPDLAGMSDMGGGGAGNEQAVQQLLMALLEMGITPEMLMQGLQGAEAGGAPPGAAPAPGGGMAAMMGGGGAAPPGGGGLAAMMGGGGGGAAGGGAGGMEVAAEDRRKVYKLAAAAKTYHEQTVKNGTFRFTEAKSAQERRLRDEIQRCIRDVLK